jgi:hypothetical protein
VRAVADFNMQILSCIAVKAEQIVYNTGVKFNLRTCPRNRPIEATAHVVKDNENTLCIN